MYSKGALNFYSWDTRELVKRGGDIIIITANSTLDMANCSAKQSWGKHHSVHNIVFRFHFGVNCVVCSVQCSGLNIPRALLICLVTLGSLSRGQEGSSHYRYDCTLYTGLQGDSCRNGNTRDAGHWRFRIVMCIISGLFMKKLSLVFTLSRHHMTTGNTFF